MIYKSQNIIDNHRLMANTIDDIVDRHKFDEGFTAAYPKYNFFGLTSAEPLFYDLFCELRSIVYNHVDPRKRVWMQSWLNYHKPEEVLKWHSHHWPIHGYISIRPHKTRTVFEDGHIVNEIGNIYIGEGNRYHTVEVDEHFNTPRITIGFDLLTEDEMNLNDNMGLIPFPS